MIDYAIADPNLPFNEYLRQSHMILEQYRPDLKRSPLQASLIVETNMPFESRPTQTPVKYGALLLHGLLDCPFSMRDLGGFLQNQGILCRAMLLPGHGTQPQDLMKTTYQDWLQAIQYGIHSLRQEVDKIILVGYSTGATLAIYHAQHDKNIAGIILLAPAIKLKSPIDVLLGWHSTIRRMRKNQQWLCLEDEIDYAKYRSVPLNPVTQLNKLMQLIKDKPLTCPLFIAMSREDETVSCRAAIKFFNQTARSINRFLIYSAHQHRYADNRIISKVIKTKNIDHYAHVSLPYSPNNFHYGEQGDYAYASSTKAKDNIYGAYNRIESQCLDLLYTLGLSKNRYRELTYNPEFDFMTQKIGEFISSLDSITSAKSS